MSYTAHPSAIIDEGAQIGDGTRIWHWVHVSPQARIGELQSRAADLVPTMQAARKAGKTPRCQ